METQENQTPANTGGQGDGGGTDPQKASYEAYQFGETTVGGANFAPVFAPKSPLYMANLAVPGIGGIDLAKEISASAWLLQLACHNLARAAGWWTRPDGSSVTDNALCFSNKLMLIVSEVAEAMEGDRKGIKDDKLPPSADRWREPSRTYPGIAAAMAAQWPQPLRQRNLFDEAA